MPPWFERLDPALSTSLVVRFLRPPGALSCHLNSALCLALFCVADGRAAAHGLDGLVAQASDHCLDELRNGLPLECAIALVALLRRVALDPFCEVVNPVEFAEAALPLFYDRILPNGQPEWSMQQDVSDTFQKVLGCLMDYTAPTQFNASQYRVCPTCGSVECMIPSWHPASFHTGVDLTQSFENAPPDAAALLAGHADLSLPD